MVVGPVVQVLQAVMCAVLLLTQHRLWSRTLQHNGSVVAHRHLVAHRRVIEQIGRRLLLTQSLERVHPDRLQIANAYDLILAQQDLLSVLVVVPLLRRGGTRRAWVARLVATKAVPAILGAAEGRHAAGVVPGDQGLKQR